MKCLALSALGVFASLSCATHEVTKSVDLHSQRVGQDFADEILAQSPFERVVLDWDEARELMYERNLSVAKAYELKQEAAVGSPLVADLMSHVQSSVGDTARGVLSPDDLFKVVKSPFEELPKHFENLASLKDFSHKMQLQAYDNVKDASQAEQTIRAEEVKLHVLFATGALLDQRSDLLKKWDVDEPSSTKIKAMLKKDMDAYVEFRKKWLNQVRDFFDAEYADVKFSGVAPKFSYYRSVLNPQFEDWQRWCVLQRSQKLATGLKELHDTRRPVVPGSNLLKSKVLMMLHVDSVDEDIQDQQGVRSSVRGVLRNWRELKELHVKQAELSKQLDGIDGMENMTEVQQVKKYSLANKILDMRHKELSHVKRLWLIDEWCWKDLSS